MEAFKFLEVVKKYESCPVCKNGTNFMLKDEVIFISCECGLSLALNQNGEELL